MYDLIGDIHGYATELKALLDKLGYREANGVWRHRDRKVIFLGDLVIMNSTLLPGPPRIRSSSFAPTGLMVNQR